MGDLLSDGLLLFERRDVRLVVASNFLESSAT
jgi:hypothetical protein